MKRQTLQDMGLNAEQVQKIMDLNGADIENAKSKAKGKADELAAENQELKAQITKRDADLVNLKKSVKDNEQLSADFKELQEKYKNDRADLEKQVANVKLTSALDLGLSGAKVRNAKAIKGLLDMDAIKLDDAGQLTGLADQLKAIRKSDPYLFDGGEKQDYTPASGDNAKSDPVSLMVESFKQGVK